MPGRRAMGLSSLLAGPLMCSRGYSSLPPPHHPSPSHSPLASRYWAHLGVAVCGRHPGGREVFPDEKEDVDHEPERSFDIETVPSDRQ